MGFLQNNFISDFFFNVLKFINDNITHNYLISVIIVVLLIKLILLPLDLRQRKSTMKMSSLTVKINSIKARYPDPQAQQKKINELYAKEGVKPMAGCLPMLIQLPILFAFYGALRNLANEQMFLLVQQAAETGQALNLPSMLWVHNIWQPDSGMVNVMPTLEEFQRMLNESPNLVPAAIQNVDYMAVMQPTFDKFAGVSNGWYLMGILQAGTLMLSQKLTAGQNQALQQQGGAGKIMMYVFPLFSGYICLTVNAVFALYWFVSNVYSIVQNLLFRRFYDKKLKNEGVVEQ